MTRSRSAGEALRRHGILLVVISFGGFAADYLFNAGLSRLLDPHAYGDFRVGWSFGAFFGVLVLLGGDRATPSALAGPFERGETAKVWEYLRFYFELSLALSVLVIGTTWAVSILHLGHADPEHHHVLAWAVLGVPVNAAGAMISRALQAARYPALASIPWRLGVPLLNLGFVGVLLTLDVPITTHHAIVFAVLTVILVALWQWLRLRRLALPRLERDAPERRPRRWLTTSLPMMGVFLVALALNQSDLYFLEALGDEHEVGYYAAAATCAHFLLIVQTTFIGLVAPYVQLALEDGEDASRPLFRRVQGALVGVLLFASCLLVATARPLLSLFGPGFGIALPELYLLLAGNLAWGTAALAVLRLQYTRRGISVVGVTIAVLVADSAANALLIPRYGMTGAAASTAVTSALAAVLVFLAMRRPIPVAEGPSAAD